MLGLATRCVTDPILDPERIVWGFSDADSCAGQEAIVNVSAPKDFLPVAHNDDSDYTDNQSNDRSQTQTMMVMHASMPSLISDSDDDYSSMSKLDLSIDDTMTVHHFFILPV